MRYITIAMKNYIYLILIHYTFFQGLIWDWKHIRKYNSVFIHCLPTITRLDGSNKLMDDVFSTKIEKSRKNNKILSSQIFVLRNIVNDPLNVRSIY